jgi:hypothetical protein
MGRQEDSSKASTGFYLGRNPVEGDPSKTAGAHSHLQTRYRDGFWGGNSAGCEIFSRVELIITRES